VILNSSGMGADVTAGTAGIKVGKGVAVQHTEVGASTAGCELQAASNIKINVLHSV